MEEFRIMHGDTATGRAQVEKQGLYYCISCKCSTEKGMCQIEVQGDKGTVNLGTCVPVPGGIGLRTKIAVKRLGRIQSFEQRKKGETEGLWIPLEPTEPIEQLGRIKNACLCYSDGQAGLLLKEI